ncbi:MAG: hypothetical protein CBC79_00010 [Gammaproteobacteria bacterium TMED119]|nr:MAG: hypothetical protein CBC79_00010 [Gammaproteobacteria bacterium TMED119]
MAILWQHHSAEHHYKVTQAGRSVRLYRNGVLHSQWNPAAPLSGHLWELFLLTSMGAVSPPQQVCVLGVGGGTVINLIQYLFPQAKIDGVDFDALHLFAANEFFNIQNCRLYHDDASRWLHNNSHKRYDLIIDDIFSELASVPVRARIIDHQWLHTTLAMLTSNGTLVMNLADHSEWTRTRRELSSSARFQTYQCALARHYRCDNRIITMARRDLSGSRIRHQLTAGGHSKMLAYLNKGIFHYRRVKSLHA